MASNSRAKKLAEACVKAVDPSYSIAWRTSKKGYTWPGTGVLRMSENNVYKALHDVAHLMIADPERRWMPEWGLGEDPMRDSPAMPVMHHKKAQDEESRTCDLQWALAAFTGGIKAACLVEDYVNIDVPPTEVRIQGMAKRYPYLPKDFAKKVIAVRRARMTDPAVQILFSFNKKFK